MSNVEQQENLVGGSSGVKPPSRQVLHMGFLEPVVQNGESEFISGNIESTTEEVNKGVEVMTVDIVQKEESTRQEENGVMQGDVLEMASEGAQTLVCREKEQEEKQGTNHGGNVAPPPREVLN